MTTQSETFWQAYNAARRNFPQWRQGQTLFNIAEGLFPEAANKLRGTDVDPFNDDSKNDAFILALSALLNGGNSNE